MFEIIASILIALIFGIVIGFLTTFNFAESLLEIFLIILLFIIGIEIGKDAKIEKFKGVWRESLKLYVGTVSGSLAAGLVLSYILKFDLKLCLAVSAGMGWYSFTGPFLAKNMGYFAGALGFTSNFFREVITLFLYPKLRDKKAAISVGGATTMDTTLPIISSFSNPQTSLIAFVHGFLISASVPLILMLIVSI